MDNFDDKKLKKIHKAAPEGMYSQVRERIIFERIKIAKTRRQLAFGSALLLIIGIVNVAIIVFYTNEKPQSTTRNTDKVLYETYFDNQISLSE